jgi:hypothetical protein
MFEYYLILKEGFLKNDYGNWIIENPPTTIHFSRAEAEKELERLRRKHPGSKFMTFRCVSISEILNKESKEDLLAKILFLEEKIADLESRLSGETFTVREYFSDADIGLTPEDVHYFSDIIVRHLKNRGELPQDAPFSLANKYPKSLLDELFSDLTD